MARKEKTIAELQKELKILKEKKKREALRKQISDVKHGKTKKKVKSFASRIARNLAESSF